MQRQNKRRIVATHDYTDEAGTLFFQVVRYEPKGFSQRRPFREGWAWGLAEGWYERSGKDWKRREGARDTQPTRETLGDFAWLEEQPKVLYGLHDLLATKTGPGPVFITEGEKHADRLRELGFQATTTAMGAGKAGLTDWTPVRGRDAVVLPDNDDPGRKHAADLVGLLRGVAADVRVLELPDLSQKGDVLNWLDAGGTADELKQLAASASPGVPWVSTHMWGLDEMSAADLCKSNDVTVDLRYLPCLGGAEIIAEEFSHVLAAIPKAGKTTLLHQLCIEFVAAGLRVLYITEESRKVWKARLGETWPQGLQLVFAVGSPADDLLRRAEWADEEVVIVDTIRNIFGLRDENDNSEVMKAIKPWIAQLRGKTSIYAHHIRKNDGDHGRGVAGAGALVGAVDRILELRHDSAAPDRRRVLRTISRIEQPPDLLIERQDDGSLKALGSPEAVGREDLKEQILAMLPPREQAVKTVELHEALGETGPGKRTLESALKELHADGMALRLGAGKRGDPYLWAVADEDSAPDSDPDSDSRTIEKGRAGNELSEPPGVNGSPPGFYSRTPPPIGAGIESASQAGDDGGVEV